MTRACKRSSLPRPYIWRLTSLSFVIWPSVCPLDQAEEMAAQKATRSGPPATTSSAALDHSTLGYLTRRDQSGRRQRWDSSMARSVIVWRWTRPSYLGESWIGAGALLTNPINASFGLLG